jgi:sugar phosphate isomerase/epimerase
MLNRRQFVAGMGAAASLAALPLRALSVHGVRLGLQSYTFHNMQEGGLKTTQKIAEEMRDLKVDLVELWAPQTDPLPLPERYWWPWAHPGSVVPALISNTERERRRAALRAWRTSARPSYFELIRGHFESEGVELFAYNYSFEPTMTNAELQHGFMAANALDVKLITSSSKLSVARRVVPFAEKHGIKVAFHNHAVTKDPDDIATMESFQEVLAMSSMFRINLDVAHYAASGLDAVAALETLHDKITNLHVHDRKANDGDSVPYGEGVTPAAQILKMNRDRGWKIPCFYELEYVGGDGRDVIAETRRELDYEIRVLREK